MLLHYLGKLKIKFYADIQQIWEKMQTSFILSAPVVCRLSDEASKNIFLSLRIQSQWQTAESSEAEA